jgi:hypothetical protein
VWLSDLNIADKALVAISLLCISGMTAELLWPHPLELPDLQPDSTIKRPGTSIRGREPSKNERVIASIAERPLFTLDRRPYQIPIDPPQEEPPQVPPEPRVEFGLSAIVTTAEYRIALLKPGKSTETVKLALGESHAGWTLTDVLADAVTLSKGQETITVTLQPERDLAQPQRRGRREH